jgi:hypothetical protein
MNHCNDFAPCGPSIGQYKFLFLDLFPLFKVQKFNLVSNPHLTTASIKNMQSMFQSSYKSGKQI